MRIISDNTTETVMSNLMMTTSTTTTVTMITITDDEETAESTVVYVWVPYSFFLVAVFLLLTFSFVQHRKRVLK